MDGDRFDPWTWMLVAARSRRELLRGMAAGTGGCAKRPCRESMPLGGKEIAHGRMAFR